MRSITSREIRSLAEEYRDKGWRVTKTNGNHVQFASPDGQHLVVTGATPSDYRAVQNARQDLRRAERMSGVETFNELKPRERHKDKHRSASVQVARFNLFADDQRRPRRERELRHEEPTVYRVVERKGDDLVLIDGTHGRQLWQRVFLRDDAVCAMTYEPLAPGELAYRPLTIDWNRNDRLCAEWVEENIQ